MLSLLSDLNAKNSSQDGTRASIPELCDEEGTDGYRRLGMVCYQRGV